MKCLGVDLGWSSGASGLCCLSWQNGSLKLLDLQCILKVDDIFTWIDNHAPNPESAIVAVDAPTLIPNTSGMRVPDRLAHKYFGRYHAGCYPANLGRPFASRTVGFGLSLEARGFEHAPNIIAKQAGRYQIESFPHAAMVHLFQLDRILKYKKGLLAERRSGLTQLRQYIINYLPSLEPGLDLPPDSLPDIPTTGTALKAVEDQLDSLICAYIAAHWWYWGLARNWVLGDRQSGYIVVPNPHRKQQQETPT